MSDLPATTSRSAALSAGLQTFNLGQIAQSPGMRQIAALVGVALAVAVGVTLFSWSQKPAMQMLYAGLSDRDSAEVVEALRGADIAFKQDPNSGAVMVDADVQHEARLQLAGLGLPRSAGGGFELMREEQGIGVSQFLENARYQHALETELARTIGHLQPIRSARVHLALPKRSAFVRGKEEPSASVLVALYSGRRLESGQVDAIVHLVGSSIPNLLPSRVSVIDESGRLLSRPGDDALSLSATQLDYRGELEQRYRARIEQLLTPVLGQSRISTQVSVDLDFSQVEETRESYAPDKSVMRSELISENRDPSENASGVPGALSNRVPTAANAKTTDDGIVRSRQSTRNFEVDRTISHTRSQPGRITRVSAAVLVDYMPVLDDKGVSTNQPINAEQLSKIESLVRDAVGFDAERGDTVSVSNISFVVPEVLETLDVPIWEQPLARDALRQLLGALVILIIAFVILRPALKSALKPSLQVSPFGANALGAVASSGGAKAAGLAAPAGADDGEEVMASKPVAALDKKLSVAREAAKEDPKRVAQLMKQWVGDE